MEIPGGRGSNVKPSEMENPGGVGIFSVNTKQNKKQNQKFGQVHESPLNFLYSKL